MPQISLESSITPKGRGTLIRVRVQPGARKSGLAGEYGGRLKLKLAAPPVDGKANEECIALIAELLGIGRGSVELIAGAASRNKTLFVRDIEPDLVLARLKPGSNG